eukprot:1121270-Amphidinium_carterae.2
MSALRDIILRSSKATDSLALSYAQQPGVCYPLVASGEMTVLRTQVHDTMSLAPSWDDDRASTARARRGHLRHCDDRGSTVRAIYVQALAPPQLVKLCWAVVASKPRSPHSGSPQYVSGQKPCVRRHA